MPDELHPLPPAVLELIDQDLASMTHVELLVLLARDDSVPHSVTSAAEAVHVQPRVAARALADLAAGGLLERAPDVADQYVYIGARCARQPDVTALIEMYDQRPVTLVRAIYHRPSSAVRSFADAFRLRPEKE